MYAWLRSSGEARHIGLREPRNNITYPSGAQIKQSVPPLDSGTCHFVHTFGTKTGYAQIVALVTDATIIL